MRNENQDYTVAEVAVVLGLTERHIYRNPSAYPGYYRTGRTIRFHKGAFDARQTLAEWRKEQEEQR